MVSYIISEYSKLIQKVYKYAHDWERKMIHWELCKQQKFPHTDKWYNQTGIHPGEWNRQNSPR